MGNTELFDAESAKVQARHQSPWSLHDRIRRVAWGVVQSTLFAFSPRICYGFRSGLLRMFGAKVGKSVKIHPTVKLFAPWQLVIDDHSSIGDHAILYNLGPLTIGRFVTISQFAHLCGGTHIATSRRMELVRSPISIGDDAWIATDAYIGPGVTIGTRAIVGARASVFKDVPENTIVGGNPARFIKNREFNLND